MSGSGRWRRLNEWDPVTTTRAGGLAVIREIRTAEQLTELIRSGVGYLYNDFKGRDPKMCPIHAMGCRWIPTMLKPPTGKLGVPKLWSDSLAELVAEVEKRGKVYAFCGSEPGLAGGARSSPRGPAIPRPHSPPAPSRPRATPSSPSSGSDGFHIDVEPGVVTVASEYRLQFDNKPETRALKAAIGDAVSWLVAAPGQMLEAVYTSASTDIVDAENVLLYNVGTGRFAASARSGLRFERVYAEPPGAPVVAHHHRYAIVATDSDSSHWRRGRLVVEASGLRIPRLDALSKPDAVWLATREQVIADARVHSDLYSLELTLTVGPTDAVRPADVVKPLVDGVVAGLQAHDGRDAEVLTTRLAARLGIPDARVEALLHDETRAWLGTRRLLWSWADSYQWNPADDDCVSAVLHVRRDEGPEWRLSFRLHEVTSLG